MSLEIIKQKINQGDGYIETKESGLIKVKDMKPGETIIWKPIKNDYKDINSLEDELILKDSNDKLNDLKEKRKKELIQKTKEDPDFVFEKEGIKDNYKKLYDDIEKAKNETELNDIII